MRTWLLLLSLNIPLFAQAENPYNPPQVALCEKVSRVIRAYQTTQKLQDIHARLTAKNIDFKDVQFPQLESLPLVFIVDVNRLPEDLKVDFRQIGEDVRTSIPKNFWQDVKRSASFGILIYGLLNTYLASHSYVFFNEQWAENTANNIFQTSLVGLIGFNLSLVLGRSSLKKVLVLHGNRQNPQDPVYLFIEGEKTYQAYREYIESLGRKSPT